MRLRADFRVHGSTSIPAAEPLGSLGMGNNRLTPAPAAAACAAAEAGVAAGAALGFAAAELVHGLGGFADRRVAAAVGLARPLAAAGGVAAERVTGGAGGTLRAVAF